jgi:hypothetical protein
VSDKTGDTVWQPDGSGGVQPQRVGGGSRSSKAGVGEAPTDGGLYLRGNGGWSLYTPSSGGVGEAPQDGIQYTRQDGAWENINPIRQGLVVQGDTTVQGAFDATNGMSITGASSVSGRFAVTSDPVLPVDVGNMGYNDERYAGSTETWYRTGNSFTASNAVQVFLSSGVREDYGPRLFTRSNDRLYPTRSGAWLYAVTVFFDTLSPWIPADNRMIAIRKNGGTVNRTNVNSAEHSALSCSGTVRLSSSDYLSVEMRVGHNATADVNLQVTNLGPV